MPDRTLLVALAGLLTLGACTADEPSEADDAASSGADPIPSVTVPAARLTPFCQAMIDLSDRLESDPPETAAATTALIVDVYESVEDQVPAAIEIEFATVLARLRGEAVASPGDDPDESTTTEPPPPSTAASGSTLPPEGDDFFEEGYSPDDDPALRVNEYVEFACRDSVNNPGPPATQPLDDIVTDDEPASDG